MTSRPSALVLHDPQSWIVMGVSGCGKSEIARRLAARLGIDFIEGDHFHPPANIEKMAAGIPLTDADRHGWLLRLQQQLRQAAAAGRAVVLSCSALKRRYRDLLRAGDPDAIFIHLYGERALIAARMRQRHGHFMPSAMLDSQLTTLEPPQQDERFLQVDIRPPPDAIVDRILALRDALAGARPPPA